MSFRTVEELLKDALFIAGKETDEGSEFYERGLEYLNAVQDALVGGGPLGGAVLEVVDWLWLRKQPRGSITLEPRYTSGSVTVALTQDGNEATLSEDPGIVLTGYRLRLAGETHEPLVTTHEGTGVTLSTPWPGEDATATFTAEKSEYQLPADFHRFASPLFRSDGERIDVVPEVDLGASCFLRAALIAPQTIRLSGVLGKRSIFEFEYVFQPPDLVLGGPDPIVPAPHRRVLSYGAAYLILLDCRDDTAASIYQHFATQWDAMLRDQNLNFRNGSAIFGAFVPAQRERSALAGWR